MPILFAIYGNGDALSESQPRRHGWRQCSLPQFAEIQDLLRCSRIQRSVLIGNPEVFPHNPTTPKIDRRYVLAAVFRLGNKRHSRDNVLERPLQGGEFCRYIRRISIGTCILSSLHHLTLFGSVVHLTLWQLGVRPGLFRLRV